MRGCMAFAVPSEVLSQPGGRLLSTEDTLHERIPKRGGSGLWLEAAKME